MQEAEANEAQLGHSGTDWNAETHKLCRSDQNAGSANELEDRAGLRQCRVEAHGFLRFAAQCRAIVTNVTQNMKPTQKAVLSVIALAWVQFRHSLGYSYGQCSCVASERTSLRL